MTAQRGQISERLHQACQQSPLDTLTVQTLTQASPAAAQDRSRADQWLPLHRACRRQPSLAVVQTLVRAWPTSVREWTDDGATEARLPIHLACQYGAPLAVVRFLAQQDPTCLQAVSPKQMYTALDFALYYYHQRRQERLNVTEAERVIDYLANARVQDPVWAKEEHEKVPATIVAVAYTPTEKPSMPAPQELEQPVKPHARPVYPRRSYASCQPKFMSTSTCSSPRKSKIIRMKLPRPAVPLR